MLHIAIRRSKPIQSSQTWSSAPTFRAIARYASAHAVRILRILILLLLALLILFMGLLYLTGRYEVGIPIIGSILFIGFSAAHYAH